MNCPIEVSIIKTESTVMEYKNQIKQSIIGILLHLGHEIPVTLTTGTIGKAGATSNIARLKGRLDYITKDAEHMSEIVHTLHETITGKKKGLGTKKRCPFI